MNKIKLFEALEDIEKKTEYIEERRISFDDLEMLCYQKSWGNKVQRSKLNGFIYIVSTRLYLSTEDIVTIAKKIKSWSEDPSSLLVYANAIGELVKSQIYIVPNGEDDES